MTEQSNSGSPRGRKPQTGGNRPGSRRPSAGNKKRNKQKRGGGNRGRGGARPAPSLTKITRNDDYKVPEIGDSVWVIPLGGTEEIGKNMTAIQYGNDIIVVDAGIEFTDEDTPGVDYILPNVKYLEDNKDKIRALVITHGHLDHIGGIPYLIDRIGNPPVYTREFGALLIKKRHEEFPHLPELNLKIVGQDAKPTQLTKDLSLEFFGLSHSIPDSTGVIIGTPYGDIVNTGDVRVDNHDGVPTDFEKAQYEIFKNRNVMLLTMDSTNIDSPGWSLSESVVVENIDRLVGEISGRVIIATFASQVERILEFLNTAKKYGRKVVVEGRSMKTNIEIVKHLQLTKTDHIIPIEEMEKHPPEKIMILATGAQGEEFAALMRISNKSHRNIKLTKSDTIILSSSVIPGNENSVTKLKDNLYRHNARIITYSDEMVHASGHGKRDELGWIHNQIPYKFFMPVHGYHYKLKIHRELAIQLGTAPENIIVPDNGSIIEIYDKGQKIRKREETVPNGDLVVEGANIGTVQDVVIRDRKALAEDGMFVIIASLNLRTGKLKKSPDIISRGFVYLRESQDLLQQTRLIIKRSVESSAKGMNPIDFDFVKKQVSDEVSKFLFQKTHKHPLVIPVVLGV